PRTIELPACGPSINYGMLDAELREHRPCAAGEAIGGHGKWRAHTVEENHPIGRRISPSIKRVAGSEVDKAPVKRRVFSGCFTALITPLRGGKVDEEVFQALVVKAGQKVHQWPQRKHISLRVGGNGGLASGRERARGDLSLAIALSF